MKTATELMKENFTDNTTRTPRSNEYKRGVLAALHLKCSGLKEVVAYEAGTAGFDAYMAGHEEGKLIYQMEKDKDKAQRR